MDSRMSDTIAPDGAAKELPEAHVVATWKYVVVWLTLLALTVLTVTAASYDLGAWNLTIALAIATLKATLVALVFMHLFWSERFNAIVLVTAIVFLATFVAFTAIDSGARGRAEAIEGQRANMANPF